MKAWEITNANSCDNNVEIIFSETAGQAKAIALFTDAFEDCSFTDLRAHRKKAADIFYEQGKVRLNWMNPKDRYAFVTLGYYCHDTYCDDKHNCETCCVSNICEIREEY